MPMSDYEFLENFDEFYYQWKYWSKDLINIYHIFLRELNFVLFLAGNESHGYILEVNFEENKVFIILKIYRF